MKQIFCLLGFLVLAFATQAQRIKLVSGDPSVMAGETKFNIQFTYERMSVGRYDNEADYIADKKADYNKKEAGRGDKWEKAWVGDRKSRFEPAFMELFEKHTPFAVGNYPNSKYTIIVNTVRTEPGFNVYVTKKNAEIDLEIKIVETATQKVICEYSVRRAPGRTFGGNDYDTGERIEESYAAAGKYFGKELKSDVK